MTKEIKLYLIFSHTLSSLQKTDAKDRFGINEIVFLPESLLKIWSSIPPNQEKVSPYIAPILEHLKDISTDDYVLVQGDFGATYIVVEWVKSCGATPIYATTERTIVEDIQDDKSIKTSIFSHVRYRIYGE